MGIDGKQKARGAVTVPTGRTICDSPYPLDEGTDRRRDNSYFTRVIFLVSVNPLALMR